MGNQSDAAEEIERITEDVPEVEPATGPDSGPALDDIAPTVTDDTGSIIDLDGDNF